MRPLTFLIFLFPESWLARTDSSNLFIGQNKISVLSFFILCILIKTRSIQRTQTPPRLWRLTLICYLDLKSRSRKLMSLDVLYLGTRYDVCECNSLRHVNISSFFVTFDLRLWPSSSVKVTFTFIIRWTLYCCVLVPSTKFVGSIEFEIWTIV